MSRSLPSRLQRTGDDGSALIEFVGASVLLLLPLVYLLLSVFTVQRGSFAAAEAAREAGRLCHRAEQQHRARPGRLRSRNCLRRPGHYRPAERALHLTRRRLRSYGAGRDPAVDAGCHVHRLRQQGRPPALRRQGGARLRRPADIRVIGRYALSVDRFRAPA